MSNDTPTIDELREQLPYPAFNPTVIPAQVDKNTVHIRGGTWDGPIVTVTDRDEDNSITDLVEMIDGHTHIDEILDSFEESQLDEVVSFLEGMSETGVIYDSEEHGDDNLYPHLSMHHGFKRQERERLHSKDVLIVNASDMGPQIAEDLLEIGVNTVSFCQPVRSERRSIASFEDSDDFRHVDESELDSAIERTDFMVYTADQRYVELTSRLNERTYETNTPWVSARISAFDGIVGPAIFPDETACFECYEERVHSNVPNPDGLDTFAETTEENPQLSTTTLPSFSRALAGYLSTDLVYLLSYGVGYTAGRVITFSSLDLSMESNRVLKLPRCEVCGKSRGEDVSRFVTLDNLEAANEFNEDRAGGD